MDYLLLLSKYYIYLIYFSFTKGDIVIEYVGEVISNKVADFREKEYNTRGFGDCYMFRADLDNIVKYFI